MNQEKKKILLLSTGDINGAYELLFKIADFLNEEGHEVALVVQKKTKKDAFVYEITKQTNIFKRLFAEISIRLNFFLKTKTDPKYIFLDEDESKKYNNVNDILKTITFIPEVVISGMTDGFLVTSHLAQINAITGASIYTITYDMSPLTGGCHYAWECRGYEKDCKACPAIIDEKKNDWSHNNLILKMKKIGRV